MSYQVGTGCYGTVTQAAQVSASSQIGAVVSHGGTGYIVDASSVTDQAITYTLTPIGGGTAISATSAYTAQPCNMLTVADGLEMGWLVGGAWIAAFALVYLARVFRGAEQESDYGYGKS